MTATDNIIDMIAGFGSKLYIILENRFISLLLLIGLLVVIIWYLVK